jgi:hypothetical protein
MRTATATIGSLMEQVSQGALRLPEIQRAYVWKPAQVAGLVDSLYRRYPSGSILLWETTETVVDRDMATQTGDAPVFVTKPLYLLDGQQRVTSLHRVFTGHERTVVVFNVVSEKFQIENAATKKDRRWVRVHDVLDGAVDLYALVEDLYAAVSEVPRAKLHDRLDRIRRVREYPYYLEILDDLPYPEVTEVFVRVNSRGRALKTTDLALATLSARWPGVVSRVDALVSNAGSRHYNALDTAFVVRAFAALATDTTSPGSFVSTPVAKLEAAWAQLERGTNHTITLLKDEVGLDNSAVLPSANALVPLVYYLGTRPDEPLTEEERKSLIYWLLVSFIQSRYSASAATVIAQDVAALRSNDPLRSLCTGLGLLNSRPEISAASLAGKGSTSPFFLLSYLAARAREARDWWYGSPVALSHDGTYKVEYHHIHPQARLKATYSKAEINDLANLAFVSDKANRKIAARSPVDYFADLMAADPSYLSTHFVPDEPAVRTVEGYPGFIGQRRALLAEAMDEILQSYRPSFLDEVTGVAATEPGASLEIQAFGTSVEAGDIVVRFRASVGDGTWDETVPLAALDSLVSDLEDGRGAELAIGDEYLAFDGDADVVTVPMGPLDVSGTVDEWRLILKRELGELVGLGSLLTVVSTPWEGPRQPFHLLDSE